MKQVYVIILGLMTVFYACNSNQVNAPTIENQPKNPTIYEQISTTYEQKQQASSFQPTAFFWGWLKRIASVDAKAIAAYVAKHGTKSDWKEALLVGATASVVAAITGEDSEKGMLTSSKTRPYQHLIVADIHHIKTAEFQLNKMDSVGYYHYILVNEILQHPYLSAIPPSEVSAVIYGKVYRQARKLGIETTYNQGASDALLDQLHRTGDSTNDAEYAQLYAFEEAEDLAQFKAISLQFEATFFKLHDTALVTAYSKEMETAVLQDTTLSEHVKDVLLLTMATYRFGNAYYFYNF